MSGTHTVTNGASAVVSGISSCKEITFSSRQHFVRYKYYDERIIMNGEL